MKRSNFEGERTHEEAPSVEEPRPLSITKTTAMAAATVAIGIYMAQFITGNVAFGAPGSGYRTACMTTLLAAFGAFAASWVYSTPWALRPDGDTCSRGGAMLRARSDTPSAGGYCSKHTP